MRKLLWNLGPVVAVVLFVALLGWAFCAPPKEKTLYRPRPAPMSRAQGRLPPIARYLMGARNASGTYALPAGNPVVTGTAVTSTWANSTLSDIGAEVTDSLSRSGKGGMLTGLALSGGSSASPGLWFSGEANSGLYRAALNDLRMSIAGNDSFRWTATALYSLYVLNAQPSAGTAIVAQGGSGASAYGVQGTGGASSAGHGVVGFGGATSGAGVFGTGSPGNGAGGVFYGGGTTGVGVQATGAGNSAAAQFFNTNASTSSTRVTGVQVHDGDIDFSLVTQPLPTVGFKNALSVSHVPKAWAQLTTNGALGCTVVSGVNVASCSTGTTGFTVTYPASGGFASGSTYSPHADIAPPSGGAMDIASPVASAMLAGSTGFQTAEMTITSPSNVTALNMNTSSRTIYVQVMGNQ